MLKQELNKLTRLLKLLFPLKMQLKKSSKPRKLLIPLQPNKELRKIRSKRLKLKPRLKLM
jgi:hypothetical protein